MERISNDNDNDNDNDSCNTGPEKRKLAAAAADRSKPLRQSTNMVLLNLLDVPRSDRPQVDTSYVPPTLFKFAHEIMELSTGNKLYLGPKIAASERALDSLQQANIVAIVNCSIHLPCYHWQHFCYSRVPVNDTINDDILSYLEGATTFMDAMLKEGSVLVHCEQGMSRSAVVAIAYRMRFERKTRDQAYISCKTMRPMINPNEGFWRQLKEYEEQLAAFQDQKKTRPGDEGALDQWVRRSHGCYITCRELPLSTLKFLKIWELVIDFVQQRESAERLMTRCLHFIWGRGVIDNDFDWLRFLCDILSNEVVCLRTLLLKILEDPGRSHV